MFIISFNPQRLEQTRTKLMRGLTSIVSWQACVFLGYSTQPPFPLLDTSFHPTTHCCRSLITKRKLGLTSRYVSLGVSRLMLGDHHAGELVNEEPQKLLWKFRSQGFMLHCYSRVCHQQDYCHLGPDNLCSETVPAL